MVTMLDYIVEEQASLTTILNEFNIDKKQLVDVKHCLILATGSSYNACLAAKYYMESTASIYIDIQEPFNFLHYGKIDPKVDLVIAVSQSGKSTSTIQAVEKIKIVGNIRTIAITSDITSPITKVVDTVFDLNMGIEKVGFVTKGYSATVLNLMLVALEVAKISSFLTVEKVTLELNNIRSAVMSIDSVIDKSINFFETHKQSFKSGQRFIAMGYGPNWGTAKEFETKFTETVRKPTQGFELEAYMHGPYLEANQNHTLFYIETNNDFMERSIALRNYMRKYVKDSFTITTDKSDDIYTLALDINVSEKISPLLLIIPFQYLAYQIATVQGIDLNERIFDDFDEVLKSKI
ncbi:SIS domain-containing protein [Carnobacterium sp.]|uniref:SIS domain-containing protein n=1 Tax=Carnobacterium sp. TaxID=48221 RepID=UPI00388DEDE7